MKTINVGNWVGYKIATIADIVKAQAAGLTIINEVADFYDYWSVDDDGNDHEPTADEVFARLQNALTNGVELYAAFRLSDDVQILSRASTTLQCGYYCGQEVYYISDNKVCKSFITRIDLNIHLLKNRSNETRTETATRIQLSDGTVRSTDEIGVTTEELFEKLTKWLD